MTAAAAWPPAVLQQQQAENAMVRTGTAALLVLMGLALLIGGVWLISLGGSWYYLVAGLGFLATAVLLFARRPAALSAYAILLLGTLAWAVWEVGLDWWQLVPRGAVLALIGIWLLLPFVSGKLIRARDGRRIPPWRRAGLPLVAALVVVAGVAVAAIFNDPHRLEGRLPTHAVNVPANPNDIPPGEWHAYGRTAFGQRYSPLDGITTANVDQLEVAWHYHTGDMRRPGDPNETTYEVTPLKIDNTLYLCTPHHLAIALDADTGAERWRFDPEVGINASRQHQTCRGVSYHADPAAPPGSACPRRIFLPTSDARLIALDAETGQPCPGFGDSGTVNLWANMPNVTEGYYYSTSPPVVTRNLVIMGGAVNDNVSATDPSGVVRAYDVRTGALVWNFDAGNPEQTAPIPPGETYTVNSPNMWSIASVDEALGLVYLPLGNASPDQFGGNRGPNVERFGSSVTALDVATGQVRWVFQTVHHDLWDYDVPSQPSLVDLVVDGQTVPALVQPTKQGEVYVLDRRTGEPVLPVTETPAPQGAAEGDFTAPTQPVSAISFAPPPVEGKDMWGVSLFDQLICRIQFRQLRYEGRFTPPSVEGTLVHPGNFGVFNWGSVAVDPVRQVMFGTPSYLGFVSRLIPRDNPTERLVTKEGETPLNENFGTPYAVELKPFLSPLGLPCQGPPWGYVAGADLRTGEIAWMHRNGTVRDLAPVPLPFKLGVPDLGGPIITAGGVAFMSGTLDYFVRAYDVTTGEELWEDRLPAGGQATPMTYLGSDGRQFLLVVAGGHGSLGTKAGDSVIAYTLPAQ